MGGIVPRPFGSAGRILWAAPAEYPTERSNGLDLGGETAGAKVTVPTPDGRARLTIPPGTSSGQVFRLKGKGVKSGNLLLRTLIMLDDADAESLTEWAEAHPAENADALRDNLI